MDVEFNFEVTKGSANLFITTFRESDEEENIIDRMPDSNNTIWSMHGTPFTNDEQEHIYILEEDRHYCFECSYLIAVETSD
jgi:hypothetical protein